MGGEREREKGSGCTLELPARPAPRSLKHASRSRRANARQFLDFTCPQSQNETDTRLMASGRRREVCIPFEAPHILSPMPSQNPRKKSVFIYETGEIRLSLRNQACRWGELRFTKGRDIASCHAPVHLKIRALRHNQYRVGDHQGWSPP